ncbi:MAG: nucleotide sugar dehydrogenase [Candidatus Levyibacteriota bacterium]
MNRTKSVSIVGLGYVGLPLALRCEEKGFHVFGIVKTQESAEKINKKHTTVADAKVQKQLKKSKISASASFETVSQSNIIVICVPTPVTADYLPDFGPLISAATQIGKELKKNQLVILESTVNPGASEEIVIPLLEKESGLQCGKDFFFAYCPERINPGDKAWSVKNIPRVLGANDPKSLRLAYSFYTAVLDSNIKKMKSLKEAEAVKIVENAFRDVNIAFVNELAQSFSVLGIDIMHVLDGAETKPFSFMRHNPGCGVGGHCIPVDPYYLIRSMKKKGFSHKFLAMAREVNNSMPSYTVSVLEETLVSLGKGIKGARIGILGISYKAGISDTRGSPYFKIKDALIGKGAKVFSYDPYVPELSTDTSLENLLQNTECLVLVTPHKEFLRLNPSMLKKYKMVVIVDGRNCLKKELFKRSVVVYKGIGR